MSSYDTLLHRYTLENALAMLARFADVREEQYRAMAYRRAIVSLRDPSVTVGADLSAKIREYRETGRIRELDDAMKRKTYRAMVEFDDILGFGPATSRELVRKRIYSRAQLMDAIANGTIHVTRVQEMGLQYYDDLHRPIPRAVVGRIAVAVLAEVYKEIDDGQDPDRSQVRAEIAGSYRRRAQESRDIDILVARNDDREGRAPNRIFLRAIHDRIHARYAAADARAFQFIGLTMLGNQKYSFLLRDTRAEQVVSIDLIVVNMVDYWSALVYFTGSREFNIWLRDQCKKIGMSLSQYGLRDEFGHVTKLESEEHIFELLNIPYVEPEARTHAPLAHE
ncbi:MAG: hypothetical protein WC440_03415 [Candidatus Omnitrophota bacterium]